MLLRQLLIVEKVAIDPAFADFSEERTVEASCLTERDVVGVGSKPPTL